MDKEPDKREAEPESADVALERMKRKEKQQNKMILYPHFHMIHSSLRSISKKYATSLIVFPFKTARMFLKLNAMTFRLSSKLAASASHSVKKPKYFVKASGTNLPDVISSCLGLNFNTSMSAILMEHFFEPKIGNIYTAA